MIATAVKPEKKVRKSISYIIQSNKGEGSFEGIINDLIARKPQFCSHFEKDAVHFVLSYQPYNMGRLEGMRIIYHSRKPAEQQLKNPHKITINLEDAVYVGDDPWCEDGKFEDYKKTIVIKKGAPLYEKFKEKIDDLVIRSPLASHSIWLCHRGHCSGY
jgi:hypothetical protein